MPYEPEGPREGLNAWLFNALASLSPRLVTYALQTAMMRRQENEYLRELGVSPSHLAQVSSAIWKQALVGLTWGAAGLGDCVDLRGLGLHAGQFNPTRSPVGIRCEMYTAVVRSCAED